MWPQPVNALLRFTFYLPLSSSAAFDGFMFYFVGDFCVKNNQTNKIYISKHIRYEICNKIYGIDLKN